MDPLATCTLLDLFKVGDTGVPADDIIGLDPERTVDIIEATQAIFNSYLKESQTQDGTNHTFTDVITALAAHPHAPVNVSECILAVHVWSSLMTSIIHEGVVLQYIQEGKIPGFYATPQN